MLEHFKFENCNPVKVPMRANLHLEEAKSPLVSVTKATMLSLVGKGIWLATTTRPDIAVAIGNLARSMVEPMEEHWIAAKQLLRYLRGTVDVGLQFGGGIGERHGFNRRTLFAVSDSDWGTDRVDSKSRSGWIVELNGPVHFGSKRQSTVALSSTEAEYYAITEAACDVIALRMTLSDLGMPMKEPTTIMTDNEGAEKMIKNPIHHHQTRHIARRMHFPRDHAEKGDIVVVHVPTDENTADTLTKPLAANKFWQHFPGLGLVRLAGRGKVLT